MFSDLLDIAKSGIRRLLRATGLGPQQSEKERLLSDIKSLEALIARYGSRNADVKKACEDLLELARTEAGRGGIGTGYELLHTAERESVFIMPREAVAVKVESLQRENSGKLGTSWRSNAMRGLLDRRPISREAIAEAIAHRNTFDRNTHRKSDKTRMQLMLLLAIVIALVSLAIRGARRGWFDDQYLKEHSLLLYAVYFGLLGGFLSSAMSAHSTDRSATFQELSSNWYVLLARGLIGSAASVVVYFALQAGVINITGKQPWSYFILYFISGFSERWFLNTLATLTGETASKDKQRPAKISPDASNNLTTSHVTYLDIMEDEMDTESDYFRANVGAVIIDCSNRILAFERLGGDQHEFQLPQGGIKRGELPYDAVLREILEETGITADKINKIDEISEWLGYELPEKYQSEKTERGQVQKWYLFRFTGKDSDIKVDEKEFCSFEWKNQEAIASSAVEFRKPVYRAVFDRFSTYLKSSK